MRLVVRVDCVMWAIILQPAVAAMVLAMFHGEAPVRDQWEPALHTQVPVSRVLGDKRDLPRNILQLV